MSKLFICYSLDVRKFLQDNGCRYEVVGLNPQSKKMFWGFIKDEKLNKTLTQWDLVKH